MVTKFIELVICDTSLIIYNNQITNSFIFGNVSILCFSHHVRTSDLMCVHIMCTYHETDQNQVANQLSYEIVATKVFIVPVILLKKETILSISDDEISSREKHWHIFVAF